MQADGQCSAKIWPYQGEQGPQTCASKHTAVSEFIQAFLLGKNHVGSHMALRTSITRFRWSNTPAVAI